MKKIYIFAALATLSLAACDNNDNPDATSDALNITATIGESTLTRATDQKWDPGDQIGISSTVSGVVGPYVNVKYTTSDGSGNFSGDRLFYYKPMTLMAYYPYTGEKGTAPGANGIISADTRIGNQSADTQPLIDFLWDSKTNENQKDFSASKPDVTFTFAHKMSRLTFKFKGIRNKK